MSWLSYVFPLPAMLLVVIAPIFLTVQLCDALWRIRRRTTVPPRTFLQWFLPLVFVIPAAYLVRFGVLSGPARGLDMLLRIAVALVLVECAAVLSLALLESIRSRRGRSSTDRV